MGIVLIQLSDRAGQVVRAQGCIKLEAEPLVSTGKFQDKVRLELGIG